MQRLLLLFGFFLLAISSFGQIGSTANNGNYLIGEKDLSFSDSSLQNTNVAVHIWYPSNNAGTNVPIANGQFPVLAFGHGFNLNYLDYTQICGHLATWGYIVVSPDVQNGFNVSHLEFAKELAGCLRFVQSEGNNSASFFYQHVDTMQGVFGHSMGGGASALVPTVYSTIDAVSGLAAAETNPSAIAALTTYIGPYQIISGSEDNTANENSNQIPMYNSATGVKQWLSITGGAHCKFTDASTVCDFVSSSGSITRAEQIRITKKYVTAFFNYNLKEDLSAIVYLCGDSILSDQNQGLVTFQTTYSCIATSFDQNARTDEIKISPNPVLDQLKASGTESFYIFNCHGKLLMDINIRSENHAIDLSHLTSGVYLLKAKDSNASIKFIKQ